MRFEELSDSLMEVNGKSNFISLVLSAEAKPYLVRLYHHHRKMIDITVNERQTQSQFKEPINESQIDHYVQSENPETEEKKHLKDIYLVVLAETLLTNDDATPLYISKSVLEELERRTGREIDTTQLYQAVNIIAGCCNGKMAEVSKKRKEYMDRLMTQDPPGLDTLYKYEAAEMMTRYGRINPEELKKILGKYNQEINEDILKNAIQTVNAYWTGRGAPLNREQKKAEDMKEITLAQNNELLLRQQLSEWSNSPEAKKTLIQVNQEQERDNWILRYKITLAEMLLAERRLKKGELREKLKSSAGGFYNDQAFEIAYDRISRFCKS